MHHRRLKIKTVGFFETSETTCQTTHYHHIPGHPNVDILDVTGTSSLLRFNNVHLISPAEYRVQQRAVYDNEHSGFGKVSRFLEQLIDSHLLDVDCAQSYVYSSFSFHSTASSNRLRNGERTQFAAVNKPNILQLSRKFNKRILMNDIKEKRWR